MDDYPKMMYREGGVEIIHDRALMTFVVDSAEEERVALEEGWSASTALPDAPQDIERLRRGRPPKNRNETLAPFVAPE